MSESSGTLGLYVHIPFCSGKCHYCDFVSYAGQEEQIDRYLAALEKEAGLAAFPRNPRTLYIGGGTPSHLSAQQIRRLFKGLCAAFPQASFAETTFEANPESLDQEKLAVLKEAGVTRLSLGLQTLDPLLLKSIGRRHTPACFRKAVGLIRGIGGMDLCVDLIGALPGQSLAGFARTLDDVLKLEPEHLSVYGLEDHEGTVFFQQGIRPDEDLSRSMLELAMESAGHAGLRHYEISNFAQPGHEALHNVNYWNGGEYLGLGCAASSHLNGARSTNARRVEDYCRAVEQGSRPVVETESLEGKDKLGERMFLALRRLDGLELESEMEREFAGEIRDLLQRGLLERQGRRIKLSREGLFLANEVFSAFVAPFAVCA